MKWILTIMKHNKLNKRETKINSADGYENVSRSCGEIEGEEYLIFTYLIQRTEHDDYFYETLDLRTRAYYFTEWKKKWK